MRGGRLNVSPARVALIVVGAMACFEASGVKGLLFMAAGFALGLLLS